MSKKICIVGGCGHVGLPLGLAFATKNFIITLLDIDQRSVNLVNDKKPPFRESGAENLLNIHVNKNLFATTQKECLKEQDVVIFVTGTPVDEHHNPRIQDVVTVIEEYLPFLSSNQLIILRSTLYPGVVNLIDSRLRKKWGSCKLAFCPERILQGEGISEIFSLPQIISSTSELAESETIEIFSTIAPNIVKLQPIEAELAKLLTNAWRYLEFSIANQFYIMLESSGVDFYKVYDALKHEYPRARNFRTPGLAAGPCLFKDTMQLSAFHSNHFFLGQAAMLINEGLPAFLVDQLEKKLGTLTDKKIAILGMTFKANNDDIRESLSFKIKKLLDFKMAKTLISDPYVVKETIELNMAIEMADGIILGVPHQEYIDLKILKPFVDCWGIWRNRTI